MQDLAVSLARRDDVLIRTSRLHDVDFRAFLYLFKYVRADTETTPYLCGISEQELELVGAAWQKYE